MDWRKQPEYTSKTDCFVMYYGILKGEPDVSSTMILEEDKAYHTLSYHAHVVMMEDRY